MGSLQLPNQLIIPAEGHSTELNSANFCSFAAQRDEEGQRGPKRRFLDYFPLHFRQRFFKFATVIMALRISPRTPQILLWNEKRLLEWEK
jgi:hypothetical protein